MDTIAPERGSKSFVQLRHACEFLRQYVPRWSSAGDLARLRGKGLDVS
jgi:hypothetical protein